MSRATRSPQPLPMDNGVWDYSPVDANLTAVLRQYDNLRDHHLRTFQDDHSSALRKFEEEVKSFEARTGGIHQDAVDFFRQHLKTVCDKECAALREKLDHTLRDLDQEKARVDVLIIQLRARFAKQAPLTLFVAPQKTEDVSSLVKAQRYEGSPVSPMVPQTIQVAAGTVATGMSAAREGSPRQPDTSSVSMDSSIISDRDTPGDTHRDTPREEPSLLSASDMPAAAGIESRPQPTPDAAIVGASVIHDPAVAQDLATTGKRKHPGNLTHTPSKRPKGDTSPAPLTDRTISFDEVYQDGNAQYKHMMVLFEGHYYILKCEEHQVHFKPEAIIGAAKHLDSAAHGNQTRIHADAVAKLGYLVTGCTPELVQKNNTTVLDAYAKGYRPLRAKIRYPKGCLRRSDPEGDPLRPGTPPRGPRAAQDLFEDESPKAATSPSGSKNTAARSSADKSSVDKPPPLDVSDVVAGELYFGRAKPPSPGTKPKRYIVMVLPWKELETVGWPPKSTLGETPLLKEAQRKTCYMYDRDGIAGWSPGYEDNGPYVKKRWYPVLWFEKSGRDMYGWLHARDLSPFVPSAKDSMEPQIRALQCRAVARTYRGQATEKVPPTVSQIPSLDGTADQCEGSSIISEAMQLDTSSEDESEPESFEMTHPEIHVAQPQTGGNERSGCPGGTQEERPRPADPCVRLRGPVLERDDEGHSHADTGDRGMHTASPPPPTDRATGVAAGILLAQQVMRRLRPPASTTPMVPVVPGESAAPATSRAAHSTASPSSPRAGSADWSASETRSGQVTPSSSVDGCTSPAAVANNPVPSTRMRGGPSSSSNTWHVAAYAAGGGAMHHYPHPVRLVGSIDGIARAVVAGGPDIVVNAREVRAIHLDESQLAEGKCTVTLSLEGREQRLVFVSNGRFQHKAIMFKRWYNRHISRETLAGTLSRAIHAGGSTCESGAS